MRRVLVKLSAWAYAILASYSNGAGVDTGGAVSMGGCSDGGAGAGAGAGDGDGDIVSDGASSCVDTAGSSGVGDVDDGAGGTMGEGLGTDCAGCVVSFIDNVLI